MSCHRGDVCVANEVRSVCILGLNFQFKDVPTFVTAHTFCASREARVFLYVVPTNTGIFLRGLNLCGESRT